jgi:hypothetical protein
MLKSIKGAVVVAAVALLAACQTAKNDTAATSDAGSSTAGSATTGTGTAGTGTTGTGTTGTGTGTGTSIPALVSVNLQNVLNDLSVKLNIDRANIPVNAQVPIDVAANVCGVSVSVLSLSTGGQASCTAKTASPELVQTVQQQIAAGGNVGGGSQTTTTPTNQM